jgi:hypothetical protein
MPAKPKPVKDSPRPKLVKSLQVKASPAKPKGKREPKLGFMPIAQRRKNAGKQLEALVKMIIAWRDGQECVMKGRGKCGNGMMWNHLIAQGKSPWLRYDLGNVHWGCGVHNFEDKYGSSVFPAWFISVFGAASFDALDFDRETHVGKLHSVDELEDMVKHYEDLYQNRYTVNLDTASLVKAGYYGNIVKHNFEQAISQKG